MINLIFLFFISAFAADPDPILSPTAYSALVDGSGNLIGSSVSGTSRGLNVYDIQVVSATQSIINANNTITTSSTTSLINNMNSGLNKSQISNASGTAVSVLQPSSDAQATSIFGLSVNNNNYVFNGSTWDRARSASIGNGVSATGIVASAVYGQYRDNGLEVGLNNFSSALMGHDGALMSTTYDHETKRDIFISQFQDLKVAEWTNLLGGSFIGSIINPQVWTTSVTGSASATPLNGVLNMTTGTTASSTVSVTSTDIAPLRPASPNTLVAAVRWDTTSVAGNEKRWGAWTSTDGVYFKLASGTFSVCRIQTSVESCVDSSSFNGTAGALTLDTNFHVYEIHYSTGTAMFFQDRKRLHTLSPPTSALADTPHFPIRYENRNLSGITANNTMFVRGSQISRMGRATGRPRSFFTNTGGTTVLKREPGTLHSLKIGRQTGLGNTTLTIYDNTSATGTIIDQITLAGNVPPSHVEYDIDFNIGLTIVNSSGNNEVQISWE